MGLLDGLFKSKKQREQDKRVKDALDRADRAIDQAEDLLRRL